MGRCHGTRPVSNTILHNLNKISGRGSIVSSIFVSRFTASPSGDYITMLGRVSVKGANRRTCSTDQFLDSASSSLSELERYLWKYFQFKVISDVDCPQFCLGMLLSRLSWNMMMILMMVAACVLLG